MDGHPTAAAVDLSWIPLGAGTSIVPRCGRAYERFVAWRAHRRPQPLFHAALEVGLGGERFAIELTPVPDGDGVARGVTCQGPVGSRWLGRWRVFRYELRCWPNGTIPDLPYAVESPRRLSSDAATAGRVLAATAGVPPLVWGRDERRTGEMWNSNSAISWLLAHSRVPLDGVAPPAGGRAPGWHAGLIVARDAAGIVRP